MVYQRKLTDEYFKTKEESARYVLEHLKNSGAFSAWSMTIKQVKLEDWYVFGVTERSLEDLEKNTQYTLPGLDVT